MKYWEIIADNLSKAGWSWGCVSAIDSNARPIIRKIWQDVGGDYVPPSMCATRHDTAVSRRKTLARAAT
jgi:hypothetical protein